MDSEAVPSTVSVPARSANCSVVVVLVVQLPDFVVEREVVVETGPVGLSLAETVTVRDVQFCLLQLSIGICVAARVTEKSAPIVIAPLAAQPNSSEMNRPRFPFEYVTISRHG